MAATRNRYTDRENEALIGLINEYPTLKLKDIANLAICKGIISLKDHPFKSIHIQLSRLSCMEREKKMQEIMPSVLPVVPEDDPVPTTTVEFAYQDLRTRYDALMAEHDKLKAKMNDLNHAVFDNAVVFEDKYGNKQIKLNFKDIIHAVRRVWAVDYYMKITAEKE